jgi:hypothetical protein
MTTDYETALLTVWEQSLVRNARSVVIRGNIFPVQTTAKQRLKQIDFQFEGREIRALQQNPDTNSRWAEIARKGSRVMQFLEGGRYIAVVVDGRVHHYSKGDTQD